MSNTKITKDDLGKILTDLGLLIGLLKGNSDALEFNEEWFADPVTNGLEEGFTWHHLKPILEFALGTLGESNKPENPLGTASGVLDESWYSFKVTNEETQELENSPYYFVAKEIKGKDTALLGAGIFKKYTAADIDKNLDIDISIDPFLFAPIFQMPNEDAPDGRALFEIDENGPVEIGVKIQLPEGHDLAGINGFLIVASFNFKEKEPVITFNANEKQADGTYKWVPKELPDLPEIINPFLALEAVIKWLELNIIVDLNVSWAALLNALGFLENLAPPYKLPSIAIDFGNLLEYIEQLFLKSFNLIFEAPKVPTESITLFEHNSDKGVSWKFTLLIKNKRYGLGLQVTNIDVSKKDDKDGPRVLLQLGALTKDKTKWISEAGGEDPAELGLNFWILEGDVKDIKWDPQFEVASVGLDIDMKNGQPLFNIKDYSFKSTQNRGYFSSLGKNTWGVATAINNISLPLGPQSGGKSDNPVASTLLESDDKEKPSVNPEFSFITAYVKKFYLQLFDKKGKKTDVVELPVQKSFGPVELSTIGVGWNNPSLLMLFQLTGGLKLSGLDLNLSKLSIGVPVTDPGNYSKYKMGLEGIGVSFKNSGIEMSGGLYKDDKSTPIQYNGSIAIQAATWGIGAIGSFAVIDGAPSMFVFGTLNAVLGGPAFFVVTGVSAGFGYNRDLVLPELSQVKNYPLVKGAVDPSYFGSDDPADALGQMSEFIPPKLGNYWLAAGVKFSSFELVNSFALLAVAFKEKIEVSIIGSSHLVLPKPEANVKTPPYVNAEFQLLVVFSPEDGVLKAEGLLTNNSFVIDKNCKLTGGFAFYTWFKDQKDSKGVTTARSGDFVLSIGGYHPSFAVPSWYPQVPRININWQVNSNVNITGEAYFALTPSCVMAGGKMAMNYKSGNLRAWFTAWSDFLISWNPFHYDIEIGITVGASYKLDVGFTTLKYSISLGAQVNIWGPEFSGTAKISWWVISFTVNLGAAGQKQTVTTIHWDEFKKYFLPLPTASSSTAMKKQKVYLAAEPTTEQQNVLKINTNSGLDGYFTSNETKYWIVNPQTFDFNIQSNVPASQISFSGNPDRTIKCNSFGIRPLGSMVLEGSDSDLKLTISKDNSTENLGNWVFKTSPQSVPYALWGTVNDGVETPSSKSIENITMGISSATTVSSENTYVGPPAFEKTLLDYTNIKNYNLPIVPGTITDSTLDNKGSVLIITNTLMVKETERTDIFTALQGLGTIANQDGNLDELAKNANNLFQGSPMLNQKVSATETLSNSSQKLKSNTVRTRVVRLRKKYKPLKTTKETVVQNTAQEVKVHTLTASIRHYQLDGTHQYAIGKTHFSSPKGKAIEHNFLKSTVSKISSSNNKYQNTIKIGAGTTQIWNIEPTTKKGSSLKYDGKTAIRLLAIDEHRRVIFEKHIPSGKQGNINIPSEARQVVLRTHDATFSYDGFFGWHTESHLTQANPQTLIGNGVVVRGKSPNRIGKSYRSNSIGTTRGFAFLKNNISKDKDGNNVSAWVDTSFIEPIKQAFVLVSLRSGYEENKNAAIVRLSYRDLSGRPVSKELPLKMTGMFGNEYVLSCTIPNDIEASNRIQLSTQIQTGWELRGVAGSVTTQQEFSKTDMQKLLHPEAITALNRKETKSKLTLTYTLKNDTTDGE